MIAFETPEAGFDQIDHPLHPRDGQRKGPSSPSGGSVGLGFAIPASTVESVVNSLEHAGVVSRGYLGVKIQPVNQDIADGLGLEAAAGALIDNVEPGTPAAEAGLKSGDVITKLNAKAVRDRVISPGRRGGRDVGTSGRPVRFRKTRSFRKLGFDP